MNKKNFPLAIMTVLFAIGCAAAPLSNPQASQVNAIPTTQNTRASSPSSQSTIATNPKINKQSRSGNFISGEHQTDGRATIFQENGSYFIELDQNFKTSTSGPDLFVILHRSPDILKISKPPDYGIAQGDYIAIAPLKSFNGKQRYEIPANISPEQYQSIAVWCRQYNATFGFAPLIDN